MGAAATALAKVQQYWSESGTLCGTVSIEAVKRFQTAKKKCGDDLLQTFEVASKLPRGVKKGEDDKTLMGLYTLARFEYDLHPKVLVGVIAPKMSSRSAFIMDAQEVCAKYTIYRGKKAA